MSQAKYFERELFVSYLNRIHPTIRKRLAAAIESVQSGEVDVSDITNELNLARLSAEDAAELYSIVSEVEEKAAAIDPKQTEKGLQSRLYAGDLMVKHLKNVAGLAEQHARIRQVKQDIRDISTLQELFRRVGEIACKTIPDKRALKEFLFALRAMSVEDGTQGTTLRPDDDVRAMDATIPNAPDANAT